MTQSEEKEIVRVCGPNYEESDIPSIIRKRDFENEMTQLEAEERELESEEEERRQKDEEELEAEES